MSKKSIYRIRFLNQGTVYEVYAKRISESEIFGFLEVEGLIFGETTSLVVDLSEERLKTEFQGVKYTYIPLHAVIRVDVVEKEGVAKVIAMPQDGSNVSTFPSSLYAPSKVKKPETPE